LSAISSSRLLPSVQLSREEPRYQRDMYVHAPLTLQTLNRFKADVRNSGHPDGVFIQIPNTKKHIDAAGKLGLTVDWRGKDGAKVQAYTFNPHDFPLPR
jgi:hypothetical protein